MHLGARVPTIAYLYVPNGCPQNDCVFTKIHESAQNTSKWPKMVKKQVKFVCTRFLDPPTLAGAARDLRSHI